MLLTPVLLLSLFVILEFAKEQVRPKIPDDRLRTLGLTDGLVHKADGRRYLYDEVDGFEVYLTVTRSGLALFRRFSYILEVPGAPRDLDATRRVRGQRGGLRTGDPSFDSIVYVRGPEDPARALLGSAVRLLLADLIEHGGTLRMGTLCWEGTGRIRSTTLSWRAQQLVRTNARLQQLARPAVVDALLEHARSDPSPGVRLACLDALRHLGAADGLTRRILRQLAHGGRGAERARAAAVLDELEPWLDLVNDRSEDPEARTAGLQALARRRGPLHPAVVRTALSVLEQPSISLRLAALEALAEPGGQASLPSLRALLVAVVNREHPEHPWLMADSGIGVTRLGTALAAHGDEGDLDDMVAAIGLVGGQVLRGLTEPIGRSGEIRHVPALLARAAGASPGEAAALHSAVTAIQVRAVGARAGSLSVAEPSQAGAVSVADARHGALEAVGGPPEGPA